MVEVKGNIGLGRGQGAGDAGGRRRECAIRD